MHLGPTKVKPLIPHVLFAPRAPAAAGHNVQRVTGTRRNEASYKRSAKADGEGESDDDEMKRNCHFNRHIARYGGSETTGNTTRSLAA